MALIIPAGFGLLSIGTRTEGDPETMYWTCGVDVSGVPFEAAIPEAVSDEWGLSLAAVTSSIVDLVEVRLRLGPVPTGPTYLWTGSVAGSSSGSLLPPNCAVLFQKRTGLGGRMNRGRAYVPGISSISATLDSGGNFADGTAVLLSETMEAFWTGLSDLEGIGSVTPVLLHSASSDPTPITEFVCVPKIATQRRRLRP